MAFLAEKHIAVHLNETNTDLYRERYEMIIPATGFKYNPFYLK